MMQIPQTTIVVAIFILLFTPALVQAAPTSICICECCLQVGSDCFPQKNGSIIEVTSCTSCTHDICISSESTPSPSGSNLTAHCIASLETGYVRTTCINRNNWFEQMLIVGYSICIATLMCAIPFRQKIATLWQKYILDNIPMKIQNLIGITKESTHHEDLHIMDDENHVL